MSESISRRTTEFQRLFGEVRTGESVIECKVCLLFLLAYSCALQREILAQGKLFVTTQRIAFHANIIGWVTNVCIA